jgi:uncharacterized protein (TIGR00251 family)
VPVSCGLAPPGGFEPLHTASARSCYPRTGARLRPGVLGQPTAIFVELVLVDVVPAGRRDHCPSLGAMSNSNEGSLLKVRVIPRAKRDEVGGERAGRLLVRTTAPPVDEHANIAVRRLVAEYLGVPRQRVKIESGHHSRDKVLRIDD